MGAGPRLGVAEVVLDQEACPTVQNLQSISRLIRPCTLNHAHRLRPVALEKVGLCTEQLI